MVGSSEKEAKLQMHLSSAGLSTAKHRYAIATMASLPCGQLSFHIQYLLIRQGNLLICKQSVKRLHSPNDSDVGALSAMKNISSESFATTPSSCSAAASCMHMTLTLQDHISRNGGSWQAAISLERPDSKHESFYAMEVIYTSMTLCRDHRHASSGTLR